MPTLLPYITSDSTFSIRLVPTEQLQFPFVVISESGGFTRILKGELTSDHGSIVATVFLIMGRDCYRLAGTDQELMNNARIDQCWQRAYRHFSTDPNLITLSRQTGDDSSLVEFEPLLFCRETDAFFHPPCPRCGRPLELCKDDDLLGSLGLRLYTKSLSRYLYCRDCHQKNRPVDFYSYEPDGTDPDFVKDYHLLIEDLGALRKTIDDGFPCPRCPLHSECFSGEKRARARIAPFSFYPFHLLALKSPSINAHDFLALVSGAGIEDIRERMDRESQLSGLAFAESCCNDTAQSSPLLFEGDPRSFLEILYLKLSLLGQLARIIFSNAETLAYPDVALSLDRIWVDLQGKDSLLPYFWNFKARLIDIGQCSMPGPHLPKMPPSYGSYLLGSLWFQALVSNILHTNEEIHTALAEHFFRTDAINTVVDEDAGREKHAHLFSPDNIYWNPEDREPDQEWLELWAEALGLGWALLKSSASGDFTLTEDAFWQSFDRLRQDIRESLFLSAEKAAPRSRGFSADSAIHAILHDIMDTWSKPSQGLPDDMDQTVIISGKPSQGAAQEIPEETVILKPGQSPAHQHKDEEDVFETVILSSEDAAAGQPQVTEPEIPETVIIKPGQTDRQKPGEDFRQDASSHSTQEEPEATIIQRKESPDETVVMRTPAQQSPAEDRSEEEDLLEETVILSPQRDKD